jgi:hypothetical protein
MTAVLCSYDQHQHRAVVTRRLPKFGRLTVNGRQRPSVPSWAFLGRLRSRPRRDGTGFRSYRPVLPRKLAERDGEEHWMPLPRSLANIKREIAKKNWEEARRCAGGRTSRKKYRMPTKVRPTAECWWCQSPTQTRDHLFKACPKWKGQQKTLWAEVRKETGRGRSRWKIRIVERIESVEPVGSTPRSGVIARTGGETAPPSAPRPPRRPAPAGIFTQLQESPASSTPIHNNPFTRDVSTTHCQPASQSQSRNHFRHGHAPG